MIIFFIISCFIFSPSVYAQTNPPKISIIIDDLGYDETAGLQVANLPGPVVCAVLPDIEFSKLLAESCHAKQKEVILHTPMEALTPHKLGPGGLRMTMDKSTFLAMLMHDLQAVPFVSGLNNHEGSRLTAASLQMQWLMEAIKTQNLFFIDSVTSAHTVANKMARTYNIPTISRDVFLDDIPTETAVRKQFQLLLDEAASKGQAVAIGHPYPATLTVLQEEIPKLAAKGYTLVPISQLISNTNSLFPYWNLPFLKQIWQQITAERFYPMPPVITQ